VHRAGDQIFIAESLSSQEERVELDAFGWVRCHRRMVSRLRRTGQSVFAFFHRQCRDIRVILQVVSAPNQFRSYAACCIPLSPGCWGSLSEPLAVT
jgi:hypothetical protein